MSSPNFENIDQWLFEYTEGNLSPAQESQLLDFISLHPEVISDLKAWKQAKIQPVSSPSFSTAHLIKPAFPVLPTLLFATIGVVAILIGWLGFNQYTKTTLYTKSSIDTDLIKVNEDDLFTHKVIQYQSLIDNQGKVKQQKNSIQPSTLSPDLFITPTYNTPSNYTKKHFEIEAPHLDKVLAYLNPSKENDEKNIHSSIRRLSKSDVAKKAKAKKIQNTFGRIKRIANQSVALRNTKSPHYHAPMMTGFKANSAMVGSTAENRIQATSRLQWIDQSNTQLMNTISWDSYVHALRGGLGIDANYNAYNSNDLNNSMIGLAYSPKFSINNNISFEPALRFKLGVIHLNPHSELIGDKIEINRHNIIPLFEGDTEATGTQLWYRDIGLGFMLNTEWLYLGFNADNLGRHNNNFYSSDLNKKYRENIHYTAVIGTEYRPFTRDFKVNGYGLFQKIGDLEELWMGGNFQYKWLQIGAGISTNLDFGASSGIIINRFSFHYNIDYTKSRLLENQFLSHQITMKIGLKPNRYATKLLKL